MASDTVPAAADGPNTPPETTPSTATGTQPATPTGGLSDLLAPVQPARFTINPPQAGDTPTAAGTDDTTGLSSADYHQQNTRDETQAGNTSSGTGKAQQSIWRAWLLAGAERWKKGADARNKALDIKKARAQALQVKESRTVNRSEKFVGGNTSSGTSTQNNAGKALNNKARKESSGGPKNSSHTPKHGPSSGRGGGGHGHAGSGGGGGGRGSSGGSSGGGAGTRTHGGRGTDSRKTPGNGPGGKDTASLKRDTKTPAKPEQGGKQHDRSGSGSKSPGGRSHGSSGGSGKAGAQGATGKDGKPGKDTPTSPSSKSPNGSRTTGDASKPGAVDLIKKLKPGKDRRDGRPDPSSKGPEHAKKTDTDTKKPTPDVKKPKQPPATGTGTGKATPRTQPSREAGYRDGARAAGAANHVIAYRDGVRDGWKDKRDHGRREATRLDQAHTRRKQERQTQPQAQPQPKTVKVPPMPTHAPGPQPIQVNGVSNTGISLGTGADRTHLSHGEVRSLKQFERALRAKANTMARIAEGSRLLKSHAEQQLKHVTWLTEQARIVEGGDQLLAALLKLQDAAKVQAMAADEIVTRAVRAHEACTVLLANVDTRYGGIYKAVVDSGLIAPADLHYYKDTAHAV